MKQESHADGWIDTTNWWRPAWVASTLMSDAERFIQGAFNPENVETLSRAYKQALHMLGRDKVDDAEKARLAKHLMEIARTGEVEVAALSAQAVRRLLGQDPAATKRSETD